MAVAACSPLCSFCLFLSLLTNNAFVRPERVAASRAVFIEPCLRTGHVLTAQGAVCTSVHKQPLWLPRLARTTTSTARTYSSTVLARNSPDLLSTSPKKFNVRLHPSTLIMNTLLSFSNAHSTFLQNTPECRAVHQAPICTNPLLSINLHSAMNKRPLLHWKPQPKLPTALVH